MHAGDLHVAAERDRADPVLDAAAGRLHDRGREAQVELARAHADGARGEEVARLVEEDQDREREDRNADAHLHGHQVAGAAVGLDQLGEVARGRAVDVVEHVLDGGRDVEEADPSLEERLDGDLVGGVVGARVGAAALAGLAGEREHAERLEVGLVELERAELERRGRRRGALRVGERVGDRDAHVGVPQVRDRGAVAEAHEAVDDRRRVDDHLDPLVREAEEEVRLDHLEALVGERGGVDRDLRAHRPGRVRERLLGRHVR